MVQVDSAFMTSFAATRVTPSSNNPVGGTGTCKSSLVVSFLFTSLYSSANPSSGPTNTTAVSSPFT